jgi:hypothetical protein
MYTFGVQRTLSPDHTPQSPGVRDQAVEKH